MPTSDSNSAAGVPAAPIDAGERPDVLVDTSVAVALVVSDHSAHASTVRAVQGLRLGLSGHAWFETYSVLTRLPAPARRSPADVVRLLAHDFPASRFLDQPSAGALGDEVARLGIAGGAVYDALVGAAARGHGVRLLTRDARALAVYASLHVDVELLVD